MLKDEIVKNNHIRCLDVGVGANCIYPIIGVSEYGWEFVGADVDSKAIAIAQDIVDKNTTLSAHIELRLQPSSRDFFTGIIKEGELFDLTVCNPPFHGSLEEAQRGTRRKLKNLKGEKKVQPDLNFSV